MKCNKKGTFCLIFKGCEAAHLCQASGYALVSKEWFGSITTVAWIRCDYQQVKQLSVWLLKGLEKYHLPYMRAGVGKSLIYQLAPLVALCNYIIQFIDPIGLS